MTAELTPDALAELWRLYSEWQETVNPYGFRLMPSGEYYALAAAAAHALPALLAAAAERDALAAEVERVRALHFGEYVEDEDRNRCFECGDGWPCPTARALDGGES